MRAENCRACNIGGPKVLVKAYVPATVAFPLLALGTGVVNSRCETWKLSPRHIFQILFKHTSAPNFPQSSLKIVKTHCDISWHHFSTAHFQGRLLKTLFRPTLSRVGFLDAPSLFPALHPWSNVTGFTPHFPKPISHLNTIFYLLQPWFLRAVSAPRIQEVALEAIFSPRVFQIWLAKTCFHPSLLEDKSWQVNASPKFPKTIFECFWQLHFRQKTVDDSIFSTQPFLFLAGETAWAWTLLPKFESWRHSRDASCQQKIFQCWFLSKYIYIYNKYTYR